MSWIYSTLVRFANELVLISCSDKQGHYVHPILYEVNYAHNFCYYWLPRFNMYIFNYRICLFLKGCHILESWSIYSNPYKAATSKVAYIVDNLVNLVKNESLHEVNAANDVDQKTEGESRIHQWRSMTLNQQETGPLNGHRDTTSLPGDQAWSNRDQANWDFMESPLEEENSLKRVEYTEQHYCNKQKQNCWRGRTGSV